MRILALSDIHGDKTFIQKMALKAIQEKVDLVILAGDLVDSTGSSEGIVGPFRKAGLEVALIPGNHEGMAEINFLVEKYKAKNLHGYALKMGNVGIFGCGYGDVGIHQLDDDNLFKTLKKGHGYLADSKFKVMVTHVQPKGSILNLNNDHWGSSGVRKAVEELKPDLHICGHVHETHGIEEVIGSTRVINVGKTGKIIEF